MPKNLVDRVLRRWDNYRGVECDEQSNELSRRSTTPIARVMRLEQRRSADRKHTRDAARVDADNTAMLWESGEVEHAGVEASAGKDRGSEAP
jgi:hypothetical protein